MFQFRPFQAEGINQVAILANKGTRRIAFQAPTGAGKTVLFCGLSQRFITKYPSQKVIIAVHREELLQQTIKSLKKVANIDAAAIIAGYNTPVRQVGDYMVPHNGAQVIVGMVETLNNRFKKYENYMGGVGMLIVDECHLANFNKIYDHFPKSLIVGFTATPISANKRAPLNLYFDDIVSPVTIKELIKAGHLARNNTITIKNHINRKKLSVKGNDFDEQKMAATFSTPKHVDECVKAYAKCAKGQKTMVFNCNVEHSKLVNDAFVAAGYNSRHMDGNASSEDRKDILKWFANTHDAILNNVALYTTGFDEPTVLNIIINRATMSLPLWLQMCGRGSRSIPGYKEEFNIIDLGANVAEHLDWSYPHDWKNYFNHPEKVGAKKGNAPTKLCVTCEAMIHLSVKICPYCGANNAKEVEYDKIEIDLEVLTKGIQIEDLMKRNAAYAPYQILHIAKTKLVQKFRQQYRHNTLSQPIRESLNERYQLLVKDWCTEHDKKYNKWHKDTTRDWMMAELNRCFGKIESPENEPA